MSSVKRGRGDGGVVVKVEETESDIIDAVRSMRDTAEAHYSYRDAPPAHYTLKIDSFSKFRDAIAEGGRKCYTSQIFEACGYTWKLSLYPKGDEERSGKGHISMYLIIDDTKDLPIGWEVNVVYKFFVLDQLRYKFLVIEDSSRRTSRFNAAKTEWGISKLFPCSDFQDNCNGLLIHDTCVFGAEVIVVPRTSIGECVSPVKDFCDYTYKWEIYPFSSYTKNSHPSDVFTAGNFKWSLLFYPKGDALPGNDSLSLYLSAAGLDAQEKVNVTYKLCIQDQRGANHREKKLNSWFTFAASGWGCRKLVSLNELNDPSNGFLLNDKMIIQVHITNMFTTKSATLF